MNKPIHQEAFERLLCVRRSRDSPNWTRGISNRPRLRKPVRWGGPNLQAGGRSAVVAALRQSDDWKIRLNDNREGSARDRPSPCPRRNPRPPLRNSIIAHLGPRSITPQHDLVRYARMNSGRSSLHPPKGPQTLRLSFDYAQLRIDLCSPHRTGTGPAGRHRDSRVRTCNVTVR